MTNCHSGITSSVRTFYNSKVLFPGLWKEQMFSREQQTAEHACYTWSLVWICCTDFLPSTHQSFTELQQCYLSRSGPTLVSGCSPCRPASFLHQTPGEYRASVIQSSRATSTRSHNSGNKEKKQRSEVRGERCWLAVIFIVMLFSYLDFICRIQQPISSDTFLSSLMEAENKVFKSEMRPISFSAQRRASTI